MSSKYINMLVVHRLDGGYGIALTAREVAVGDIVECKDSNNEIAYFTVAALYQAAPGSDLVKWVDTMPSVAGRMVRSVWHLAGEE